MTITDCVTSGQLRPSESMTGIGRAICFFVLDAIGDLPDGALVGFHGREQWDPAGPSIRWTGPAALLRLGIEPGDHRLRFAWRSPRPPAERCLTLFFNGHRIAEQDVLADDRSLEVRLPRKAFRSYGRQELALTCRAFRPSDDGGDCSGLRCLE